MEIFTARFNELLKEYNIKQSEIADYCNVSRQTINDYCKGRNYPSLPVLITICKFFDVTSDYMLGLKDN